MQTGSEQYAVGDCLTGVVHLVALDGRLAPTTTSKGRFRAICGTGVTSVRGSRYRTSARVILEDDLETSRLCKRCLEAANGQLPWLEEASQ